MIETKVTGLTEKEKLQSMARVIKAQTEAAHNFGAGPDLKGFGAVPQVVFGHIVHPLFL